MINEPKKVVGYKAAEKVTDGQKLGLGTGSTVEYYLERLGQRIREEGLNVEGIPTSIQTEKLAIELGIPLATFDELQELDLYVDGADQIDPCFRMIKGGGGALLREKMVASCSAYKIIIVDSSKVVDRLGTAFALPVEIVPFGWKLCERRLGNLDCIPWLRMNGSSPFITNNGNYIMDCRFLDGIKEPEELELSLSRIPGVLCSGLFIGLADEVLVGSENGIETMKK